ncbi:MAG: hypothetical protein AAGF28_00710 [Pseudomonadota bacterium]
MSVKTATRAYQRASELLLHAIEIGNETLIAGSDEALEFAFEQVLVAHPQNDSECLELTEVLLDIVAEYDVGSAQAVRARERVLQLVAQSKPNEIAPLAGIQGNA